MRITLRLLGLDILDLEVSTEVVAATDEPGDSTANAMGFAVPEAPPLEVTMPEWR